MKKLLSVAAILGIAILAMSFKGSYAKLWSKFDDSVEKNRPETSLDLLNEIMKKSLTDKKGGAGHFLKAYIISDDISFKIGRTTQQENLKRLEIVLNNSSNILDKAIINFLLVKDYASFYNSNRYMFMDRTDVASTDAEVSDIRLWSTNQFQEKIKKHFDKIFVDEAALLKASSKLYDPLIIQSKFGAYFNHDLYHVLLFSTIDVLSALPEELQVGVDNKPIVQLIERSKKLYDRKKEALALLELSELNLKINNEDYLDQLSNYIDEYKEINVVVEAVHQRAQLLLSKDVKEATNVLNLCNEYIFKYPKYARIDILKETVKMIEAPAFQVDFLTDVYPSKSIVSKVDYKNISDFTLSLYTINPEIKNPQDSILNSAFVSRYGSLIESKTVDNLTTENYQYKTLKDVEFTTPDVGYYLLSVTSDRVQEPIFSMIHSTNIKSVIITQSGAPAEVLTVDARTGKPIEDVKVDFIKNRGGGKAMPGDTISLLTDERGKVTLDELGYSFRVNVSKGEDISLKNEFIYTSNRDNSVEQQVVSGSLLSDRAIYRPGQTVYLKGYVYKTDGKGGFDVVPNHKDSIIIADASGAELYKAGFTTNEFGTFDVKYTLPEYIVSGPFSASVRGVMFKRLQVEEYKRPTFAINFNPIVGEFAAWDKVKLTGVVEAFNGSLLKQAKLVASVKYNNQVVPYRLIPIKTKSKLISQSEVELLDGGLFEIEVDLPNRVGSLTVDVTVTTLGGESQSASKHVWVSEGALSLGTFVNSVVEKEDDLTFIATLNNFDGEPIDMVGKYALSRKTSNVEGKAEYILIEEGEVNSNTAITLQTKKLISGEYKLDIEYRSKRGVVAKSSSDVILFSMSDEQIPTSVNSWMYVKKNTFNESKPAVVAYGTNVDDAYVYINYYSMDGVLLDEQKVFSKNMEVFTIPYKEEYRDGILVSFLFVKDYKVVRQYVTLAKESNPKNIQLQWKTFRDKMVPGVKEKWVLQVTADGKIDRGVEALALMYDASLDQILKNYNHISKYNRARLPYVSVVDREGSASRRLTFGDGGYVEIPPLKFDEFYQRLIVRSRPVSIRGSSKLTRNYKGVDEDMIYTVAPASVVDESVMLEVADTKADGGNVTSLAGVRSNFSETAFFIPYLYPNEKGEMTIEFEVPEQLTKWNIQALAHDKKLNVAELFATAHTAKDFTISPNMPRFIRHGDSAILTSVLKNDTKTDQKVKVILTLFDPITNKASKSIVQNVLVRAKDEMSVVYPLELSGKETLLGCRIEAVGAKFSDGEQHIIPILSNEERIVESAATYLFKKGTFNRSFDSFFNNGSKTATNKSITVEFAIDPIWFTIQPLLSIWNEKAESSIEVANTLYANAIGYELNARYGDYIQSNAGEAPYKNLLTNQELKSILLEETPWNLRAQNEKEELAQLAQFIATNANGIAINSILQKLKALQNSDGGWSWYSNMVSDSYTTLSILRVLSGVKAFDVAKSSQIDLNAMLNSGLNFLFEKKKSWWKDQTNINRALSTSELQSILLMVENESDIKLSVEADMVYKGELGLVENLLKESSVYNRALAYLILNRLGNKAKANEFAISLREHILVDRDGTAHFGGPEFESMYNVNQVEAHTAAAIAIYEEFNNQELLNQMKSWLVMKLQREAVSSPFATINVLDLFSKYNEPSSEKKTIISVGQNILTLDAKTPYIKRTFKGNELLNAHRASIMKESDSPLWGGIYATYFERLDQVSKSGTEIRVDAKLYKEVVYDQKVELVEVKEGDALAVGDVVVSRIEFELTKDLDFLHIKSAKSAGIESFEVLSGPNYSLWWRNGGYIPSYMSIKDASTNYFYNSLKAGAYVLESRSYVSRTGVYQSGLTSIQSVYAPEVSGHSASVTFEVK